MRHEIKSKFNWRKPKDPELQPLYSRALATTFLQLGGHKISKQAKQTFWFLSLLDNSN